MGKVALKPENTGAATTGVQVSKNAHGGSNPSSPVPRAANYRVCGF